MMVAYAEYTRVMITGTRLSKPVTFGGGFDWDIMGAWVAQYLENSEFQVDADRYTAYVNRRLSKVVNFQFKTPSVE